MYAHHKLAALAAATLLALVVTPAAQAGALGSATATAWHHRAYKPTGLRYVAYDNERCTAPNTVPELRAHAANVFRYIVSDNPAETYLGAPCIRAARAAGYHTYLSIQYQASDTPHQVAAHIRKVLNAYGPQWAVAIGNEEDFSQTVPEYLKDWDAAEPVVAKMDPSAIRVLADAPPEPVQGRPEQLIKSRPIGAQAYAYHCYKADGGGLVSAGLNQVHRLARFARSYRLPVWCSEMTPGLNPTNWLVRQTTSQWATNVRRVVSRSPNLQMISYYVWPSIGAY